jgi:hypothetical protein
MRARVGIILAGFAALPLAGCPKKTPPGPPPTPEPTATPQVIPPPKPTPTPTIPRKVLDTAQLFNGVTYTHKLQTPQSERLASQERNDPSSYMAEIRVTIQRPRPSSTLEDFRANDAGLAEALVKLKGMPGHMKVARAFDRLYDLKASWVKERLSRLDQLLTRHNYYDCETILEIAPPDGQRVLLFKGDMDVNTDGSDGDRNVQVDGSSRFFQPQTSYRWRKVTQRPNPFLEVAEEKLAKLKDEYAVKGLTAERNAELREGIQETSRRIYDLKTWSFLVSATDPSIVVPGFMLRGGEGERADVAMGDYAAVIFNGKAYPAIVGDAGPSFKFGEASLRLCRELNPKSSANTRPVSQLNVAYVVFPGTADPPAPPDLKLWGERCRALLAEAGLGDLEVHEWEDLVQPWPAEVVPEPSPSPGASPAEPPPTGEPAGSATPAASATPVPDAVPAASEGPTADSPAPDATPQLPTSTPEPPSTPQP